MYAKNVYLPLNKLTTLLRLVMHNHLDHHLFIQLFSPESVSNMIWANADPIESHKEQTQTLDLSSSGAPYMNWVSIGPGNGFPLVQRQAVT